MDKLKNGVKTEHSRTAIVTSLLVLVAVLLLPTMFTAAPSVYPTGTTRYDPDKAWNGYTIHDTPDEQGAVLIDMNGQVVRHWTELTAVPSPFRILPGGYVMGGTIPREPHQEAIALVQLDWDGNVVWEFQDFEEVETEDGATVWASRLHHDWQREGNPIGYYAPDANPRVNGGKTLVLSHTNLVQADITDKRLEDDVLLEVTWDGDVTWKWLASEHLDEFGFSEAERNALYRSVQWNEERESADWLHINAASYVGPNHWYDDGDDRFHPENIIWSSREANIMAIIDREGAVVWRMGPDYRTDPALRELGQIIGQHNPHIIPKGLPGAGNLLVFDNGGEAGYGTPTPSAPTGRATVRRINSRVLEIDPVTFEKMWEYTLTGTERHRFFSHYVSNVQRLPNGNTMVTEGADGRIFELTADSEIVWEYVNPFFGTDPDTHRIYRAHRIPYDWVPQLSRPVERRVTPPNLSDFRLPPDPFN